MPRRVVVTGIGLICSVGNNAEAIWQALLAAKSGIGPITSFDAKDHPCKIAGEVKDFDASTYIEKKEVKKMGRFMHFAIAATDMALEQSGLKITEANADRVGVYIGSGIGGFEVIEREKEKLMAGGPSRVSPFFIPASIVNLASGQVSIRTGAKGPNSAVATACTTGAHAIGDSFRLIQHGYADAMIAGGAEATITPLCIAGFGAMKALSTNNENPTTACRPWDRDRDGFIVGEGSGIVILEEYEMAKARGAHIWGEVIGYGMSGDAYHMASPSEDGDGPMRVMKNAMADAGVAPEAIDYINAHATSTPAGDVIEALAFKKALGEHAYKVAISSTKSMTGHLLGGAGALEAGITLLAMRDQVAPPTANLENPGEGCDLDFIPNQARPMKIETALSNSFGFGGTNGCLIFRKV
ncbi:MAG: beta-ketoacyl-ACP synthase II [Bryobacter sp.]|nr:beta-ketoacyl-ACP synthase II [Bryobacter sp.]